MTTTNKLVLANGLAAAGGVAGIVIAIKRHSGFWGGLGWFILGGIAGRAIGSVAAAVLPGDIKVEA